MFLVDGATPLKDACQRYGFDFRYERQGNRNSVERVFREVKRRTSPFSNCFSDANADASDGWLKSFSFAWVKLNIELYQQSRVAPCSTISKLIWPIRPLKRVFSALDTQKTHRLTIHPPLNTVLQT